MEKLATYRNVKLLNMSNINLYLIYLVYGN